MDWPHGQENRSADDRLQGVVKIRRCFPQIPGQFCTLINEQGNLTLLFNISRQPHGHFNTVFEKQVPSVQAAVSYLDFLAPLGAFI